MFAICRWIERRKSGANTEVVEAVASFTRRDSGIETLRERLILIAEVMSATIDIHLNLSATLLKRDLKIILALRLERRSKERRKVPLRLAVLKYVVPHVYALVVQHNLVMFTFMPSLYSTIS